MKTHDLSATVARVCSVLVTGVFTAFAQTPPVYYTTAPSTGYSRGLGWYLSGDLGPSFMQTFQSSRFGYPINFSPDAGLRFSLEPGCDFFATSRLSLGGEFETGAVYNRVSVWPAGAPLPFRGESYQVPVLGDLVLNAPTFLMADLTCWGFQTT